MREGELGRLRRRRCVRTGIKAQGTTFGEKNLLRQVIRGGVGGCTHEDRSTVLSNEMEDNRGGGLSLPCAGWPLDKSEGSRKGCLNCRLLRIVKCVEATYTVAAGEGHSEGREGHPDPKEAVAEIRGN